MEKEKSKLGFVYDYLGNEIKEGMTVKIINTKPIWSEMQKYKTTKKGLKRVGKKVIAPDKIWNCAGEYPIVKNKSGQLQYVIDDCYLLLSGLSCGLQDHSLITIKGISDIEPEMHTND